MRRGVTLLALACLALAVGCANKPKFGPQQCDALAGLAVSVSVRITEVADEDKAELVAEYGDIVADVARVGCSFIPPELPE